MTETREFHQLNDSLLQEYQRFCESAFPASVQTHVAEQAQGFFRRHPAPADWSAALRGAAAENEAVLSFLALTGRLQVPYADLIADKLPLERLFRAGMADLKRWFEEAAHALGYGVDFCEKEGIRCWLFWAALEGRRPAEVTLKGAQDLRTALAGAASGSPGNPEPCVLPSSGFTRSSTALGWCRRFPSGRSRESPSSCRSRRGVRFIRRLWTQWNATLNRWQQSAARQR